MTWYFYYDWRAFFVGFLWEEDIRALSLQPLPCVGLVLQFPRSSKWETDIKREDFD